MRHIPSPPKPISNRRYEDKDLRSCGYSQSAPFGAQKALAVPLTPLQDAYQTATAAAQANRDANSPPEGAIPRIMVFFPIDVAGDPAGAVVLAFVLLKSDVVDAPPTGKVSRRVIRSYNRY